jgi:hypothetical protein
MFAEAPGSSIVFERLVVVVCVAKGGRVASGMEPTVEKRILGGNWLIYNSILFKAPPLFSEMSMHLSIKEKDMWNFLLMTG